MDKKIVLESLKAFTIGAIVGLIIMYFRNSDNFVTAFICGIGALSIHARNNSFSKR